MSELIQMDSESNQMIISPELLSKIRRRSRTYRRFEPGEDITIVLIPGKTVERDGVELPVFNLGDGREIDLDALGNLLVADENLILVNKGDEINECLDRDSEPTKVVDLMKKNDGKFPTSLKIAGRYKEGARKAFIEDEKKGPIRKKMLEEHGINTSLDSFPVMLNRRGADESKKENWRFLERVAVSLD